MSVTIVPTEAPELVTLGNMEEGQAFLDGDDDIMIRSDAYDDETNVITVMQLTTGEIFEFSADIEYQPVKIAAKIVS